MSGRVLFWFFCVSIGMGFALAEYFVSHGSHASEPLVKAAFLGLVLFVAAGIWAAYAWARLMWDALQ